MTVWTILAVCAGLVGGFACAWAERLTPRALGVVAYVAVFAVTVPTLNALLPWPGWQRALAYAVLFGAGHLVAQWHDRRAGRSGARGGPPAAARTPPGVSDTGRRRNAADGGTVEREAGAPGRG
jgi:hypothetical protein